MRKQYFYVLVPIIAVSLIVFYLGYSTILNNDTKAHVVQSNKQIESFSAKDLAGKQYEIDNDKGVHVYEVFASWCIPCQKSVPNVLKFSKVNDVAVTGIAYRDVPFEIEKFQNKYGEFDRVIMSNGSTERAFSVRSVPQTLFTKSGVILYRVYGEASQKDLEKVLALVKAE